MLVGGEEKPAEITPDAWRRLARDREVNGPLLLREVRRLAERVKECAAAISATALAEGWHRPVVDEIRAVIDERAARLAA